MSYSYSACCRCLIVLLIFGSSVDAIVVLILLTEAGANLKSRQDGWTREVTLQVVQVIEGVLLELVDAKDTTAQDQERVEQDLPYSAAGRD